MDRTVGQFHQRKPRALNTKFGCSPIPVLVFMMIAIATLQLRKVVLTILAARGAAGGLLLRVKGDQ